MSERVLVIADWKTSSFIGPEMRYQLGAYAYCPTLLERPEHGLVIQITEKWCKPVVVLDAEKLAKAYRTFCALKQAFDDMVDNGDITIKSRYPYDGAFLPSVTEVLSHMLAKPGLLNWYWKMGKEGKDPNQIKVNRGDEGSQVHHAIHLLLKQVPFKFEGAAPWLADRITHFAAWQLKADFQPLHLEQKVYNTEIGYAGTLDTVGTIKKSYLDEVLGQSGTPLGLAPAVKTMRTHPNRDADRDQELARFIDSVGGDDAKAV